MVCGGRNAKYVRPIKALAALITTRKRLSAATTSASSSPLPFRAVREKPLIVRV
jgi:hypothetical protein